MEAGASGCGAELRQNSTGPAGLRIIDPDGLQLGVLVMGPDGLVTPTKPGLFVAIERRRGIAFAEAVHRHHTRTNLPRQAQRISQAAGITRSRQAVDGVVGPFDRFIDGRERRCPKHRAEDLLNEQAVIPLHAIDNGPLLGSSSD